MHPHGREVSGEIGEMFTAQELTPDEIAHSLRSGADLTNVSEKVLALCFWFRSGGVRCLQTDVTSKLALNIGAICRARVKVRQA